MWYKINRIIRNFLEGKMNSEEELQELEKKLYAAADKIKRSLHYQW